MRIFNIWNRKGDVMAELETVSWIVEERLNVDYRPVNPEAYFVDDLGADSLDMLELIMSFEEAFNVNHIPEAEAEKMVNVMKVVEYFKKH